MLAAYLESANTYIASRYLWDLFYAKLRRREKWVFSTCASCIFPWASALSILHIDASAALCANFKSMFQYYPSYMCENRRENKICILNSVRAASINFAMKFEISCDLGMLLRLQKYNINSASFAQRGKCLKVHLYRNYYNCSGNSQSCHVCCSQIEKNGACITM